MSLRIESMIHFMSGLSIGFRCVLPTSCVSCISSIQFATLSAIGRLETIYIPTLLKISDTLVQPVNKEMAISHRAIRISYIGKQNLGRANIPH